MTAVVLIDEEINDANPFVLGGYKGVTTVLTAIEESMENGSTLQDALKGALHNRRHPYVEIVSGQGIPFYTIRDGRLELYSTMLIEH